MSDPLHFCTDTDPAPALFVSDLEDANKSFLSITVLFEGTLHLHHSSQIKSQKSKTVEITGFLIVFPW
jgi:hypothetical protein